MTNSVFNCSNKPAKTFVFHVCAQFWISWELVGVRHCQDGGGRSHDSTISQTVKKE